MVSRNTRGIDFQPIVFGLGFALRNLLYDSTRWALPETRQKTVPNTICWKPIPRSKAVRWVVFYLLHARVHCWPVRI